MYNIYIIYINIYIYVYKFHPCRRNCFTYIARNLIPTRYFLLYHKMFKQSDLEGIYQQNLKKYTFT